MRSIRTRIANFAAVLALAGVAAPSAAQAHGAYPHNQWRGSGCVSGLSWWYVDSTDPQHSSHDWYHAHAWKKSSQPTRTTAGNMQATWAAYGWECGFLGYPAGDKLQWHDAGRLVQRQQFLHPNGTRYQVQLVYNSTSYYSPYSVQIWAG